MRVEWDSFVAKEWPNYVHHYATLDAVAPHILGGADPAVDREIDDFGKETNLGLFMATVVLPFVIFAAADPKDLAIIKLRFS